MAEELERRVELLEEQVATLTEALRSTLSWRIGSTSIRQHDNPARELVLRGTSGTEEILNRL